MKKFTSILLLVALCMLFVGAYAESYDEVMAIANPTYVRLGPGTNYDIVDEYAPYTYYTWSGDIRRDGRGVEWYGFYDGDGILWMSGLHSNLINSTTGRARNNGRNGANSKKCSVYAKKGTDILSGPGNYYGSIGYLSKGQGADFTGFKQSDGKTTWYQIKLNSMSGWVSSRNASIR